MSRAAVLGSGSWGTAFAKVLADAGTDVTMWARREELAASITDDHENKDYLSGIELPSSIRATSDPVRALDGADIVVLAVPMLDKFKIDDVVGAIPVHLFCGIWGTIAVVFYGDASLGTQLLGILAYGAFTFVVSFVLWLIIKGTMGLRVDQETEINGLDMAEMGMEAYPEFSKG